MAKKTPVQMLRQRISQIVKEEVQRALKEDVNPVFNKVPRSQKDEFSAWIMRQYFDPAKHSDKVWFDPSVTAANVLDYLSSAEGSRLFPNSPRNLVNLWKLKLDLGNKLGTTADEDDAASVDQGEEEEKAKYQTGDVSLKDIGQELGGVTPTMINKLASAGMEKFAKLTGGKHPEDLDDEELESFLKAIKDARVEAASEFASKLKAAKSVNAFLQGLAKEQVLTPTDLKIISPEELEGLQILKGKPSENITLILLQDIEDDDNLFKTFQSLVSKKVFPPGKRGRPKKKKD